MIQNIQLVRPIQDILQEIGSRGRYRRQQKIQHVDARDREQTPARISREIKQVSEQALGEGLTLQSQRNISIAISRKYLRKGEGRFRYNKEDQDDKTLEDKVEDIQAGYSTYVAGIVYIRGIREQDGVVEGMRQKFRRASENQHRFLGFYVLGEAFGNRGKRKASGQEEREEGIENRRQKR